MPPSLELKGSRRNYAPEIINNLQYGFAPYIREFTLNMSLRYCPLVSFARLLIPPCKLLIHLQNTNVFASDINISSNILYHILLDLSILIF